ncbi:MAG: ABC transporter permease [Anaerovoracaceae bacterium]
MNDFLIAVIIAATPLLFATLGELLSEKAGNLNLGVEGMMLMGAVIGFRVALATENPVLTLLATFLAGAAGAAIYAFLTISLRTNQVVTGLTLTIFGTGFASFAGKSVAGIALPQTITAMFRPIEIPLLSKIPLIGQMLFNQDIYVYLGYACTIIIGIYLAKTRVGLNLRAVGENAAAADASGINVSLYKYINVIIGGGMCGLGGAYMSVVMVPIWQENIVAGRGWIAVALVIFASWKSWKAFVGAVLFGALSILGYRLQAMGIQVSQYLIDMIPYIATILVVIISTHRNRKEDLPPGDLGNAYFREER